MKTKIGIEYPDQVSVTLTITMKLCEWKQLREQLSGEYPSWQFGAMIRNAVCRVEQVFESREETS